MWWVKLGITPERIEPGKPRQNGHHERMHKTLKAEIDAPPAANLARMTMGIISKIPPKWPSL